MNIQRPLSKQPIPHNAKNVFHGILFDVYQWQQEQFDGSFKTFEKIKRRDTVGIIPITEDGKMIVTEQQQPGTKPFIGLPGGIIDEGEDPFTAAKRELLEETGYEPTQWELYDATQPVSKIDWAIYIFLAKGCKKIAEPHLDSGEKMTYRLIDWHEFLDIVIDPRFRDHELSLRILREYKNDSSLSVIKRQFFG